MVQMPAVPPYSSTTIAMCTSARWKSRSSSPIGLVSGTRSGSRSSARRLKSGAVDPKKRTRSRT